MKNNRIILCSAVIVIIILISFSKFILAKPVLEVKRNNISLEIQLTRRDEKDFSVNIDIKNIEDINYLKGYILYNSNEEHGNNFDLYNGDKNVQVYIMNDKGSGVYIKTKLGNYLISGNTSDETLALYNELKEDKSFEVKYKKQTDMGVY